MSPIRLQRTAHLTFIIVGGGPTGVELAGAIKELAVDVIARDFRIADTRRAHVILIEAGARLLPALHPVILAPCARAVAAIWASKCGSGSRLRRCLPTASRSAAERLRSHNVIWAAGVRAAALVGTLGVAAGSRRPRAGEADCSVPGYPHVFVIGDAAYLIDSKSGRAVPGVSQGALQMGRYVARIITEESVQGASRTRATRLSLLGLRLHGDDRQVARGR